MVPPAVFLELPVRQRLHQCRVSKVQYFGSCYQFVGTAWFLFGIWLIDENVCAYSYINQSGKHGGQWGEAKYRKLCKQISGYTIEEIKSRIPP